MYYSPGGRCISAAYACFEATCCMRLPRLATRVLNASMIKQSTTVNILVPRPWTAVSVRRKPSENAGAKTVLTVLFMVAAIATTLIFHLGIQNDQTEEETRVEINPVEQTKIHIPNTVLLLETSSFLCRLSSDLTNKGKETAVKFSGNETAINIPSPVPVVVPLLTALQVQDTSKSNTLAGPSQTLSDEVDSSLNVSVSAHTVVGTSDTASLLHQTTIETSSFHIERDVLPEGQETSPGVANDDSGVPSQPSHQPSPPVVDVVAENEAENPNLKIEFKVATWVSMISAGAIVSVVSGLVGNEKATLTRKILFKAFSTLNYISLVLGVGLFVLTLTRPNIPGLVKIIKFIMWIAIGSTTYALGCATCLLLPKLVEVVLVLVVPLVMVCLIAALSFGCRN